MPPKKPDLLSAYLGKLTRHIAINRYIHNRAQKRTPGTEVILSEAEEFIPDPAGSDISDEIHLRDAINSFVASLSQEVRVVFVRRYWYLTPLDELAREAGMRPGALAMLMLRARKKLKKHLQKEGFEV